MNIFVTGSTGFLGKNFVHFMNREHPEHKLFCLVRSPEKAAPIRDLANVEIVNGDLFEPDTYMEALKESDIIIHTAALVGLKNGKEFYTANEDATRSFVDACKACYVENKRIKRFVNVSSISSIDRDPNIRAVEPLDESSAEQPGTDYGKSKLLAEKIVEDSGIPYCTVRPAYFFGPFPRENSSMDRLIYNVRDNVAYTSIPFPGKASAMYVEDLADILWIVAEHPKAENDVFFTSNLDPITIGDVYPLVAKHIDAKHTMRNVSEKTLTRLQHYLYTRSPENPLLKVMFENAFYCSSQKLYTDLGYKPRYGLEEGIKRTVAWYRENGKLTPAKAISAP